MKEITPEIKSRTFLFDIPISEGMVLRNIVLQLEVFNKCLVFAREEAERMHWAEIVLKLEHERIETILQMASYLLGCSETEVNKYLAALPIVDNTGQRMFICLWEGSLEQLQMSNTMH